MKLGVDGGDGRRVGLRTELRTAQGIGRRAAQRAARRARTRRKVRREAGVLPFKLRGGARPGAGRKPKGDKAGVPHRSRVEFVKRRPVHVTVKLRPGLRRLRQGREYRVLRAAFAAGCERGGFQLVHYAVMNDHLHLIVEAEDAVGFVRGVQGLLIRVARALNRLWGRKGKVFADRFHDHHLATPTEVRNALRYVLANAEHHARQRAPHMGRDVQVGQVIDMFTSGPWFDGWLESVVVRGLESEPRPVARPRTWLLGVGWQRSGGRLSVYERAVS